MRVVVTGATGFTGNEVVRSALDAGLDVTAVTRDSRKLEARSRLTVVTADITEYGVLDGFLRGHDAVIHCIGVGGTGTGKATTVVSEATAQLVPAMVASGVTRLVALSNVGAGSSIAQGSRLYHRVHP